MKNNSPTKRLIITVLMLIIVVVMVVVNPSVASATGNIPIQVNSPQLECNPARINQLEKVVKSTGATADNYATLGNRYLSCGNFTAAADQYNQALKLAEPGTVAALMAELGKVDIDFAAGKIEESKKDSLTKDISQKISSKLKTTALLGELCDCPSGRTVLSRCILPCP